MERYGSMKKIPPEEILGIPLGEVKEDHALRTVFFRELLKKYNGKIENIPIDELSAKGPVVLIRGLAKRGMFICLAKLKKGDAKPRGYGKKYYYEEEFKKDDV